MSDPKDRSWILNAVGFRLMSLGRLGEAVPFYERGNAMDAELEDWHQASITYRNLAELHAYLGALTESADAAREALALARRAENKQDEYYSLLRQAWAAHLRGDLKTAGSAFQQAEALLREIEPGKHYLYSLQGILHADHLRRAGDADYARRVTEANLEICERNRWPDDISRSHRVLGDLDVGAGQHESARAHYDEALKIARSITFRPALMEALLARGRWAATLPQVPNLREGDQAFSDLNEALGYAVDGGYRIYEADARIGLAWAHLAETLRQAQGDGLCQAQGDGLRQVQGDGLRQVQGDGLRQARQEALRQAQDEAERAQQMSVQMGYHWGQVDAAEVLAALASTNGNSG